METVWLCASIAHAGLKNAILEMFLRIKLATLSKYTLCEI
ncbi:hypothetical protein [Atribacter laminatus]